MELKGGIESNPDSWDVDCLENPFNGIERFNHRLYGALHVYLPVNPFNGIERYLVDRSSADSPKHTSNPFNGIERTISVLAVTPRLSKNPFNGIERETEAKMSLAEGLL